MATRTRIDAAVESLRVSAYTIPTDEPEQDGTFDWDSTTIVVCEVRGGGDTGLGYTYGGAVTGILVEQVLVQVVCGRDAMDVEGAWHAMGAALRNIGRPGIGAMAVAAVDVALWDLKARLLGEPLLGLLPARHAAVPIYGSGGFTSYSLGRIREQFGRWIAEGLPRVKMKVGRQPERDPARLDAAREAIGDAELFVDANGAFSRAEARTWAERYRDGWGVRWFEEPVSSDDAEGLGLVRASAPDGLEIAAGEYGYLLPDFERLAPVVDCLQADVTRCGGITGLLQVDALASSRYGVDLSAHCAPAISAHAFCAVERLRHLEYFHDHVRVESLLFDGLPDRVGGVLRPDRSRPGHGLELKRTDAERWAA
jgi:L-alanine-DL-glutamate epimerase-like enolase superfamily enzyme